MFLPHFDVFCDLLLNRHTTTWNLSVLYNEREKDLPRSMPRNTRLFEGLFELGHFPSHQRYFLYVTLNSFLKTICVAFFVQSKIIAQIWDFVSCRSHPQLFSICCEVVKLINK